MTDSPHAERPDAAPGRSPDTASDQPPDTAADLPTVCICFGEFPRSVTVEWMAEEFDRSRFRPHWVFQGHDLPDSARVMVDLGDEVTLLSPLTKRSAVQALVRLFTFFRRVRPRAVHAHQFPHSAVVLTAALLAGVKRRVFTRMYSNYHHEFFPRGLFYDRYLNAVATGIIATCENVKQVLVELDRVPATKIHVVNYGVRVEDFENVGEDRVAALEQRWGIPAGKFVVGMVSRFEALKGIQYVVPAFAALRKEFPDLVLLLANAMGPDAPDVRAQLEATLPDDAWVEVSFEADIAALYAAMDVFLHVPVDRVVEAFGQVYLESMAAGLPTVVTLSGIAPEYVRHMESSFVVPYRSADAIEDAVRYVVTHPAEAQSLGGRARATVCDAYSVERMARAMEDVYLGS